MNYGWITEGVGLIGVIILPVAYFLLQTGRLRVEDLIYSLLNLLGSLFIFFSLLFKWNLSAALIEIFWALISLYGVVTYFIRKRKDRT